MARACTDLADRGSRSTSARRRTSERARRTDSGTPRPQAPRGRDGFALALVLLALALVAAVGAAALASALGQLRAASMASEAGAARVGAQAAIERAMAGLRGSAPDQVGDTAGVVLDEPLGARFRQRVRSLRLGPEFHLMLGEVSADGGPAMRAARVAWWLDPAARTAGHRAVVESGSLTRAPGALVEGNAPLADRAGATGCDTIAALLKDFGRPPIAAAAPPPAPPEWRAGRDGADFDRVRLGWFGRTALRSRANHRVAGGSTVPGSACRGCWSGLVFAAGAAAVSSPGSGVLVVDGDLSIGAGVSWDGLVLAAGDIAIGSAAVVTGLVRAGGAVSLGSNARVAGSACSAYHALAAADSLARPIALPGRSWTGPLAPVRR